MEKWWERIVIGFGIVVAVVSIWLIIMIFSDDPEPVPEEPQRDGIAGAIDDASEQAAETVDAAGDLVNEVGGEAVETLNDAADTYEGARDALDRFRNR